MVETPDEARGILSSLTEVQENAKIKAEYTFSLC